MSNCFFRIIFILEYIICPESKRLVCLPYNIETDLSKKDKLNQVKVACFGSNQSSLNIHTESKELDVEDRSCSIENSLSTFIDGNIIVYLAHNAV